VGIFLKRYHEGTKGTKCHWGVFFTTLDWHEVRCCGFL